MRHIGLVIKKEEVIKTPKNNENKEVKATKTEGKSKASKTQKSSTP